MYFSAILQSFDLNCTCMCVYACEYMCLCVFVCALRLSDSENFTITIVKIAIFTIMNTIVIVDLLNISIHK